MKWLILLIILSYSTKNALAQGQVQETTIKKDLRDIRNLISYMNCGNCQTKKDSLKLIINKALLNLDLKGKEVPMEYAASIKNYTIFAKASLNKNENQQSDNLSLILNDFNSKFGKNPDYLTGKSFFNLVKVKVSVKNDNGQVDNLTINYCTLAEKPNYQSPLYSFPGLTSPAESDMVPGIYIIWVNKRNAKLKEKIINVDPRSKNEFSLTIE